MDLTQHYNLKKPTDGDKVDVQDLNDNADITDMQLNALADLVAKRLLKTDLINQIINDPNKAASAATVYSVNERVTEQNNNLEEGVVKNYSDSVTPNAHAKVAINPSKEPFLVSDYGVTGLATNAEFENNLWVSVKGDYNTQIRYNKRAGYVMLLVNADGISITPNIDLTLCTLPTGYRPIEQVRVANYKVGSYIMVLTNGNVVLSRYDTSDTSSLWIRCNVVFQSI